MIPCFNDGATLPAAVESVRGGEPCELVVIDDGSTDERTLLVLADLEREGVRVLRQQNSGPSAARMAGVHTTSAPYVLPLDADDVMSPGGITALADALDAHEEAVLAWGDVAIFGGGTFLWRSAHTLDPWWITYVNEIPNLALSRRSALVEVGGWQVRDGWEDWDLWMSFAERGWAGVYVPGEVFRYRVHASRRWADSVTRYDEFYADLRRRHPRLFAERPRNWRRSRAPRRLRLLFPAIAALPFVSDHHKRRLCDVASYPIRLVRLRRRMRGRG